MQIIKVRQVLFSHFKGNFHKMERCSFYGQSVYRYRILDHIPFLGKVDIYDSLQLLIQPWIVHQVPSTAGWAETVWNKKFAWHFEHDQHWESNRRPSDFEFNVLSTWPSTPTFTRNEYRELYYVI